MCRRVGGHRQEEAAQAAAPQSTPRVMGAQGSKPNLPQVVPEKGKKEGKKVKEEKKGDKKNKARLSTRSRLR